MSIKHAVAEEAVAGHTQSSAITVSVEAQSHISDEPAMACAPKLHAKHFCHRSCGRRVSLSPSLRLCGHPASRQIESQVRVDAAKPGVVVHD